MARETPTQQKLAARRPGKLLTFLGIAIVTVGLLALLEGLAGLSLLAWDFTKPPGGLPSRRHSSPDSLLGWINTPNWRDENMYGRGGLLAINSLSIRDVDETPRSEHGLLRIVCSGDSFTFGIDVANRDTWCEKLEGYDPRIRTLNLGHPGYGIDQAYLHYRRDGEGLEHAVHVFAFIPDDVRRIRLTSFAGSSKPVFEWVDGEPILRNVPVPRTSSFQSKLQRRRERLNELHLVAFARRALGHLFGYPDRQYFSTDDEARRIAVALMDSAAASAGRNDRISLFVLLGQTRSSNAWNDDLASYLTEELGRRGLRFLDLRAEMRRLPADSLGAMFALSASGHYSVRGNDFVAEHIWRALNERAEFVELLGFAR